MKRRKIEIMDTTLRDGEQTSGVSFATQEKVSVVRLLLEELHIDRVEVASARVSEGEFKTVQKIAQWAQANGHLNQIEVLGFVDGTSSIEWITSAGCKVMNLLCKGSLKHCNKQLKKTPEEHFRDIKQVISNARKVGVEVNVYLEDWSNGMKDSEAYVFQMVDELKNEPIKRFMLPDTLGVLNPDQTAEYCKKMIDRYPDLHFDFHAHNDYDLAVANVFEAVKSGIQGIHVTVNGLGERAGNAPLTSVLAVLEDHLKLKTNINEENVFKVSKIVESYSGIRIPANKPVIGDNVFTQVAGVHADGDKKNNLYYNDLLPERFGRTREYALGKTSGKANIENNLKLLGIELDEESTKKVTARIIELGDKKEPVSLEELPYIVSDILKNGVDNQDIQMLNYSLNLADGLRPTATVKISIHGEVYQQTAAGDGQYHAFSKAMYKIYRSLDKPIPQLIDYVVVIPPGGQTDAFVQTIITWNFEGKVFKTRGLDVDQTVAAIKATMKMLNMIESGNIPTITYTGLP
ncbi:MAG: alpha-isopropylmalate synthase regulatory domain-containing protein [Dysgonamonadaceae bacterium]|jgi:D-citramalate synthase|nr:alpha-isopropylmalate synthase regulatory domain-containing protein [Dysgonamonadaceae bacterium]MDD3308868.1 alpha-isopropylmalate synthase regulatory domain-containing protein [Dysgonamonadaceae bacterium]MDD3900414.1 alpha-isopropylmalate synthase regulatory domain-containing protein [Dysgonamonadaceae bacterium]